MRLSSHKKRIVIQLYRGGEINADVLCELASSLRGKLGLLRNVKSTEGKYLRRRYHRILKNIVMPKIQEESAKYFAK